MAIFPSRALLACALGVLTGACAGPVAPEASPDAAPDAPDAGPSRCAPPPGMNGSPQTIDEVVALLDALPAPVTIPCFLESLDRPLEIEATLSRVSAQPAYGARSPRLFLFIGDQLILSIVPEGIGAPLLEMSEIVGEARSRKAELELPIATPIAPSAPYDRVVFEAGTVCGGCHYGEQRDESVDFARAYVSNALRPYDLDLVPLDRVRAEWLACRPEQEPDRCAMLEAIFGHGEVRHRPFPAEFPTL